MLEILRFFRAPRVAALTALALLSACSGGGCGNCTVPPFNAPLPGASAGPGPIIVPVSPTPTPIPTPTPVVIVPTPAPAPAVCTQGGPLSIPLGPALAPFAILAGTTITDVGASFISNAPGAVTGGVNDDLVGVGPGGARAVTGFYTLGTATDKDGKNAIYALTPPGFNPDPVPVTNAQLALTTALGTALGKPPGTTVAGDLAIASVPGHPVGTLPPGVYTSTSTLGIFSGNLTLDGGGNANSVWIFQIPTSLTTTFGGGATGNVLLTGGANACNIYWAAGADVTLGGATFNGNVLAGNSITINATTFNGRALASSAGVTIPVAGGSQITVPGGN